MKSLEVTLLNRLGDRGLGIVKDASLKQAKKKERKIAMSESSAPYMPIRNAVIYTQTS